MRVPALNSPARWNSLAWWSSLASPRRVDLAIAAGLLIWGLPDVPWWWEPSGHAGSVWSEAGSLALTLGMSVPFCCRRRLPAAALALAASVLAIRGLMHRNEISAFAAVLVGAYGLGAYSRASRRYARWLGWALLATAIVVVMTSAGRRLAAVPFALLAAAFVLGDAASARRGETAAAVEAAHQAERTRIARELHDVVAHQLSAIAVQAGAARLAARQHAAGTGAGTAGNGAAGTGDGTADHSAAATSTTAAGNDPARREAAAAASGAGVGGIAVAGAAGRVAGADGRGTDATGQPGNGLGSPAEVLATVERLSREALAELGHLLGALRRDPDGDLAGRPAPTLAELGGLIGTARAQGVRAEITVSGPVRPLAAGVELSCHRIVSEALTNVARHSPGAWATVELSYEPQRLRIEVANGPAARAHRSATSPPAVRGRGQGPPGLGIRGMRERAELYGGRVDAGTTSPDGGFRVTAVIPYTEGVRTANVPAAQCPGATGPDGTGPDGTGPDGTGPDGTGPDGTGPP